MQLTRFKLWKTLASYKACFVILPTFLYVDCLSIFCSCPHVPLPLKEVASVPWNFSLWSTVVVMYQSIPSVTLPLGNPRTNFQNCQFPATQTIFFENARPSGLPGTLHFDKFYIFQPLSRSQSLSYPMNIYKFVGRTRIYQ